MPAKKPDSARRSYVFNIRLTYQESQDFEEYCHRQGTTRSRLGRKIVRELIHKQPDLLTEEMKEFKHATRQLAGISSNLNQLTRAVNSGKIPGKLANKSYWVDLKNHVTRLRNQFDAVMDATENRWIKR